MLSVVSRLKEQGNELYKERCHSQALFFYKVYHLLPPSSTLELARSCIQALVLASCTHISCFGCPHLPCLQKAARVMKRARAVNGTHNDEIKALHISILLNGEHCLPTLPFRRIF